MTFVTRLFLLLISEASQGSIASIQEVLEGKTGFGIAQANAL